MAFKSAVHEGTPERITLQSNRLLRLIQSSNLPLRWVVAWLRKVSLPGRISSIKDTGTLIKSSFEKVPGRVSGGWGRGLTLVVLGPLLQHVPNHHQDLVRQRQRCLLLAQSLHPSRIAGNKDRPFGARLRQQWRVALQAPERNPHLPAVLMMPRLPLGLDLVIRPRHRTPHLFMARSERIARGDRRIPGSVPGVTTNDFRFRA